MTRETFYGDADQFSGWRCITCGEIIDRVIINNRQMTKTWTVAGPFQSREENPGSKFSFFEQRLKQLMREQKTVS